MKILPKQLIILVFVSCSTMKKLPTNDYVVFDKNEIGFKAIYSISSPNLEGKSKAIIKLIGGHGHGFNIVYSGLETIYFTNDYGSATPNYVNYQTADTTGIKFLDRKDTILSGQQKNGQYWKEIVTGRDFVGYLNVSKEDIEVFETAIRTLHRIEKNN